LKEGCRTIVCLYHQFLNAGNIQFAIDIGYVPVHRGPADKQIPTNKPWPNALAEQGYDFAFPGGKAGERVIGVCVAFHCLKKEIPIQISQVGKDSFYNPHFRITEFCLSGTIYNADAFHGIVVVT
jgi:hypothetical protein